MCNFREAFRRSDFLSFIADERENERVPGFPQGSNAFKRLVIADAGELLYRSEDLRNLKEVSAEDRDSLLC